MNRIESRFIIYLTNLSSIFHNYSYLFSVYLCKYMYYVYTSVLFKKSLLIYF